MISEDVETLLAGLEVENVGELKRLVDAGRAEFRRHGRRAELAAVVGALPDPRERLLMALDLSNEQGRVENGLFVYVSSNDGGDAINVSGVWTSEPDAFLAGEADSEEDVSRVVLPLFIDNVPERE
jgi:hypothetical protein